MIVDDSPVDRYIIKQILITKLQDVNIIEEENGAHISNKLISNEIDVCILDIMMPNKNGFEVLKEIKDNPLLMDIPVIVCTGAKDESVIVKALNLGAYDFFSKPFGSDEIKILLPLKVRNALELMRRNKEILYLSHHDKLTGLFQKSYLEEDLSVKSEDVLIQKLLYINNHLKTLNAFKDKLFTIFTHDVRTPISTMVNLMELLEEDYENYAGENKEIFTEVKKQVNNTYNIIENLLDWLNSQKDGMVFKPMHWNLLNVIRETMSLYSYSADVKRLTVEFQIDETLQVYADKEMLKLILRNLISNAIKFTRPEGVIIIRAASKDQEVILEVNDTGVGMEEEKLSRLFEESYASSTIGTSGEKGIGLGLLICKEFVSKWGGKIWAESKQDVGSSFYFTLLSEKIDM